MPKRVTTQPTGSSFELNGKSIQMELAAAQRIPSSFLSNETGAR
ncbi:hypothetical protein OAF56_01850 [Pirellulaceae bacterium]|nr:hypothetical protein [Pirellulaceae bacterium]